MYSAKLFIKNEKNGTWKFFSFRCRWHRWQTFIREFSKKLETIPMAYSGARGTLIYEKNLKSKISCQTPFNWCCLYNWWPEYRNMRGTAEQAQHQSSPCRRVYRDGSIGILIFHSFFLSVVVKQFLFETIFFLHNNGFWSQSVLNQNWEKYKI